jgi:hypothetical protein
MPPTDPRWLVLQWQSELKRRTRPSIVSGRQPPSVCLDDRAADRQSHSHAAGFGREEGVEQPIRVPGGDSDAAVLHGNQDLVCFVLVRSDGQFPRSVRDRLHRFDTVDHQIDCSWTRSARTMGGVGASSIRSDTWWLSSSRCTKPMPSLLNPTIRERPRRALRTCHANVNRLRHVQDPPQPLPVHRRGSDPT